MQLFDLPFDHSKNLLPFDGIVNYYGRIFSFEESNAYYRLLIANLDWKNDEAIIAGKKIVTKRKVAWYGDQPFDYTYSKTTKSALPWTEELHKLNAIIEEKSEESFNSCLCNL